MNKKSSVSVVISAYNEEKMIVDCLESVSWADEIIVIDNTSTDATAEIAQKHGAKVFTRPNNLMLNVNKNFGFTKATNEWVLSIDADERVSHELAAEIQEVIMTQKVLNGFSIPRRNIIFGKWIEHTGWYPDYQRRLFKKSAGRFEEKHVHEQILLEGEDGKLDNPLIHFNYESIAQFLHKTMVIYAPNEASEMIRKGYEFKNTDAIRLPFNEFLSRFFAREGYKDGLHGLMLSLLMAAYHLIVFAMIWEKQGFKEASEDVMMDGFKKEINISKNDMRYWLLQKDQRQVSNPISSIASRIRNKIKL